MNIYCIGDSLTEGDYGIFGKSGVANVHKENYPFFLSQILEEPTFNFGFCGITSSGYLSKYENEKFDFRDADVILVMLGTNQGLNDQNKTAYINLIKKFESDTKADVVIITSPHVTEDPTFSNCGYASNKKSAVECARWFAKQNGNKLIDLASYSEFNAENEKIYQSNDGLHYNELGYKHIATFIAKELVKIYAPKLKIKKEII